MQVSLGGHVSRAKFYIAQNLHANFILGMDWLIKNEANISFENNKSCIKSRKLLYSSQSVHVPPFSELVVIARIRGEKLPRGITGISSGIKNITSPLIIGKVLDTVDNNCVRVRCLNAIEFPIEILRNGNMAQFRFINDTDNILPLDDNHAPATQSVSPRLTVQTTEPFLLSKKVQIADSLSADEKSVLCNLIDKYADIFVEPNSTLGKCGIIKHKIELTDNTPIQHRQYRLNPKQQNIMKTKINELLKLEVIEESTSPWSALCLLVAKQGGKDYRVITDLRDLNDRTVLAANEL